jgi:hypothetical protein
VSHWNHRVVKKEFRSVINNKEVVSTRYGIHEVFYSNGETDKLLPEVGWTEDPVSVSLYSEQHHELTDQEAIEELRWTLEHMLKCLDKPILVDED